MCNRSFYAEKPYKSSLFLILNSMRFRFQEQKVISAKKMTKNWVAIGVLSIDTLLEEI